MLALARVWNADDGRFPHAGVLVQHLLDLARINIDSVDQQHVRLAVGDVEESVLVRVTDVAGQQPAVPHDFRRGLGLVPIAEHDVAAAHAQFPDLARRQYLP